MKPKLSNMDKEELRKRMSKAIGTFENQMVRRISEDCAEIAIQYFTEQLNKHGVSGKTNDEKIWQWVQWINKRCDFTEHQQDYIYFAIRQILKSEACADTKGGENG